MNITERSESWFDAGRARDIFHDRDPEEVSWNHLEQQAKTLDKAYVFEFEYNPMESLEELVTYIKQYRKDIRAVSKQYPWLIPEIKIKSFVTATSTDDGIRTVLSNKGRFGKGTFSKLSLDIQILITTHSAEFSAAREKAKEANSAFDIPCWLVDGWLFENTKLTRSSETRPSLDSVVESISALHNPNPTLDKYTVVISPYPEDFMMLSMHDIDEDSCYHPGHEYGCAPVQLAMCYNTVCFYAFKEGDTQPCARAWGIFNEDECLVRSNTYADNLPPKKVLGVAQTALADKFGMDIKSSGDNIVNEIKSVYCNGHCVCRSKDEEVTSVDFEYSIYIEPQSGVYCNFCDEIVSSSRLVDVGCDMVCEYCVDEYYVMGIHGEYIHRDYAVYLVDEHEYISEYGEFVVCDVTGDCYSLDGCKEVDGDYLTPKMYEQYQEELENEVA